MVRNNTSQMESDCCKMRSKEGYCPKPLEVAPSFLSKKWMISIIVTIGNHKRLRFNNIQERVAGISPKILTQRLRELEKEGVLQKEVYKQIPPKVEYSLTSSGRKLFGALVPLIEWADKR